MENKFFMNRRKAREQAFIFLFESNFGLQNIEDIIKEAQEAREEEIDDFAKSLLYGTTENLNVIDEYIDGNLNGWQKNRLSYLILSTLRLCIYEILYCDETPASVSINEAVELAKKYGSPGEAAYINGVLGSVVRQIDKNKNEDK